MFLYGTKSRENNGPNGQPAQCMTPSEFYKIRYIQRYCIKATDLILWLFLKWFEDLPQVTLLFICSKILNFSRRRLIKSDQNMETTIIPFKIARKTRTVLCRPVPRSKKKKLEFSWCPYSNDVRMDITICGN